MSKLIILLMGIQIGPCLALNVYSQSAKFTLHLEQTTVGKVINEIERTSEYVFFYADKAVNLDRTVNINVSEKSVEDILDILFAPTGNRWTINDRQIVINKAPTVLAGQQAPGMIQISGRVTDASGEPVIGATVVVKGTAIGRSTDAKGTYTLAGCPANGTLVYTSIGMQPREEQINGRTTINVTMRESVAEIGAVTISTGYQDIDRSMTTGSYTVVQAKDLAMEGVANIDQMLQGRVAGMLVTSPSSKVGTTAKISIRGQTTLIGNTDPLWVVDGIIMPDPPELKDLSGLLMVYGDDLRDLAANQISWLNPMDIETVTVLKDAAATAIYGAKASNGVIVIVTKRGKGDGTTRVSFVTTMSVGRKPRYSEFDLMNSKEWVDFYTYHADRGAQLKLAVPANATTVGSLRALYNQDDITVDDYRKTLARFMTTNTDWLDLLCRTQFTQSYNLSLSGGTEGMDFNVSGSYLKEQGQEKGNDNQRYTLASGVGFKLGSKVSVRTNLYASFSNKTGFAVGSPFNYAVTTSRAIPAYDENGEDYFFYQKAAEYKYNKNQQTLAYNVLNEIEHSGSTVKDMQLNASFNLSWNIIPGLKYELVGGLTKQANFGETFLDERTFAVANAFRGYDFNDPTVIEGGSDGRYAAAQLNNGGVFRSADAYQTSYNVRNILLFNKEFNENHRLNILVGTEMRSTSSVRHENAMYGYMPDRGMGVVAPNPNFIPITGSVATNLGPFEQLYNGSWSAYQPVNNNLSFFSNAAYRLLNRYIFTASISSSASNTFGQDINKRFDPTYSAGIAWDVDKEPWMKSIDKWVQQLKFRGSYGIQGLNANELSPYAIFNRGGVNTQGFKISDISSLPNPYLSWERTTNMELGMDFFVFGFLSGTISFYDRSSKVNQEMVVPLEFGSTGRSVGSMTITAGKIHNRGLEFTFNFTPIKTQDVALNLSFNTGKNWNTGKIATKDRMETKDYLSGATNQIIKGYPLGAMWAWSFKGLNPETGLPEFNNIDIPENERSSDYDPKKFLVYVGRSTPDISGGLNFNFRYKSLTLSSGLAVALGGKLRLPSPYEYGDYGYLPLDEKNLSRQLLGAWKNPGDITNIPAFYTGVKDGDRVTLPTGEIAEQINNLYKMWAMSDAMIIDNSYLRCQSIALSWTLKPEWSQKMGVNSVNLKFSMQNIFLIANKRLRGYDPEFAIYGVQRTAPKTFSFGINIGF